MAGGSRGYCLGDRGTKHKPLYPLAPSPSSVVPASARANPLLSIPTNTALPCLDISRIRRSRRKRHPHRIGTSAGGQLSDRLLSTLVRVSSSCRTHFAPSSSPSSRNTFANCRYGGGANSGWRSSHLSRASAWVDAAV